LNCSIVGDAHHFKLYPRGLLHTPKDDNTNGHQDKKHEGCNKKRT